ncbi:MAG: hypothetical protein WD425_11150, partial [Nitrospirales bacterium]
ASSPLIITHKFFRGAKKLRQKDRKPYFLEELLDRRRILAPFLRKPEHDSHKNSSSNLEQDKNSSK